MEKSFYEKYAIDVGENEPVKFVPMGNICIQNSGENAHLLTFGLGPCAGVAITITDDKEQCYRLLGHIDMGELMGKIEDLGEKIQYLKNQVGVEGTHVDIMLASSESFRNTSHFSEKEIKLLQTILESLKEYHITLKDIKHSYDSQIQISPNGDIKTYNDSRQRIHHEKMRGEYLKKVGGFIDRKLNVYVVPEYGAYMSDTGLGIETTSKEKMEMEIEKMKKKFSQYGEYDIQLKQSFNNPLVYAYYVKNYKDTSIHHYGRIPGCVIAKSKTDFER